MPRIALLSRFLLGIAASGPLAHAEWRRYIPEFLLPRLYGPALRDLADPYAVFWTVLAVYLLRKRRPLLTGLAVAGSAQGRPEDQRRQRHHVGAVELRQADHREAATGIAERLLHVGP